MKPQEKLARAVFRRYGMIPTWPVGHRIIVGDVISRTDAGVRRETRLEHLIGDNASLAVGEDAMGERIKLSDGVVAKLAARADATIGRAQIGFGSQASFLLIVEGGVLTAYNELWAVRQGLLSLYRAGRWDRSWQLVTSVRSADACTMLVSDKAGVRAEARLRPGAITGDLLDALAVGSEVVWETDGGLDSVAGHCTPLHSVLWVRKRLREPRTVGGVKIKSGGNTAEDDVDVVVVGPEEAGLADEATESEMDQV